MVGFFITSFGIFPASSTDIIMLNEISGYKIENLLWFLILYNEIYD
jgi:hypothetical protein